MSLLASHFAARGTDAHAAVCQTRAVVATLPRTFYVAAAWQPRSLILLALARRQR
jgi:hypothetical protein